VKIFWLDLIRTIAGPPASLDAETKLNVAHVLCNSPSVLDT
jgi:hypothetical protein